MKKEKEHAGLKEGKRQAKATGSGNLGTAESRTIEKRKRQVVRQWDNHREKQIQKWMTIYRTFSWPYSRKETVALFAGFLAFLFFSVLMLMFESDVSTTMSAVNAKKTKYVKLVTENTILETNIMTGIDGEAIFKTATEDMGMTRPKKNQVIVYQKLESEHVEQNEDIPK